jgi:serine/threonine protein kinase
MEIGTACLVGTVRFSSPEDFDLQQYSTKSDVWVYSCLLFEVVAERHIWWEVDRHSRSAQRALLKGQYPNVSPLDGSTMKPLVTACLSLNPDMRPSFGKICDTLDSMAD